MNGTTLEFFLKTNDLQKTKRYAEYAEFTESTSEHTYKLILMIDYLFKKLKLELNYIKCIELAIYHDFSEMDLECDIDAYQSSKVDVANYKKEIENKKIVELSKKYYSEIEEIHKEYENKQSEESKFVNACDKLEACIHVLSIDAEIMNFDFFATYSDKAIANFPKLLPFYKEIKWLMKKRYIELGYGWKKEYDNLFND